MKIVSTPIIASVIIASFFITSPASAQLQALIGTPSPTRPAVKKTVPPKVIPIQLAPQPIPVPSLKFRLIPTLFLQKPGNAALDYKNMVSVLPQDDAWDKNQEKVKELMDLDLAAFKKRLDEVPPLLVYDRNLLKHAVERQNCDWQENLEDGFAMLLPNLSEYRSIARMIALKARWHIARREFPRAIETISQGMVLARHLGQGKTLIQHLVGLAIEGLMTRELTLFVQQDQAPNLYWTLIAMPDPLVDIRQAVENELSLFDYFCPQIRHIEKESMTLSQATEAIRSMFTLMDAGHADSLAAGLVTIGYPRAKQKLKARGYDPDWVEKIPTAQAVLLSQWIDYVPLRDEMNQWFLIDDYPRAARELDRVEQKVAALLNQRLDLMTNMFLQVMPALSRCYLVMVRQQQSIAALRVLEAIRLFAHQHHQLPDTLDQIDAVPIPLNPLTAKPFPYHRSDSGAVLELWDPEPKRCEEYHIQLTLPAAAPVSFK